MTEARIEEQTDKKTLPLFGFRTRVFIALVGISSVASLVIGLVLYYFAQQRLTEAENTLLTQRSRTANSGAGIFVEGLRNPEDQTLPSPGSYASDLVKVVADPTGLGLVYVGPGGEPLAARNGLQGENVNPERTLERLGVPRKTIETVQGSSGGKGRLVEGRNTYVAVWPLTLPDGSSSGVLVYDAPQNELQQTLAYLRFGVLGAILTSVVLGSAASLLMARQITHPLSQTRDAAIRIASGDYAAQVPVESRDELGEVARAVNYMAGEIEHYVGEIQEQKRRLEAVLEATPEALVATDPGERVTMSNRAAANLLGVGSASRGKTLQEVGVEEDIIGCLREAASEGFSVKEVEIKGSIYWAYAARMSEEDTNGLIDGSVDGSVDGSLNGAVNGSIGNVVDDALDGGRNGGRNGAPNVPANGTEPGGPEIILSVRDITEHRALERSKTAFLSDVSHELRTPLTTIQSAVSLLERAEDRLDPLEHRALELAEGELGRIRGMVEELLTLTQMDSWQYSLELENASLNRILENSVDSIEAKARRFGIEVNLYETNLQCNCDSQKLYQVFLNLLDNAVKYSESGARVDITAGEGGKDLVVRVKDTGLGIPEEDLPHLFERFYRVDKNRSRATGGSGLGLAISKQIVEMHGGSINVESTLGSGSTFTIRLPKSPQPSGNYVS